MNKKHFYLKALFIYGTASLFAFSSFAQGEVQVFKTLDGAVSYCPSVRDDQQLVRSKHAVIELKDKNINDDQLQIELKVSLVTCSEGTWIIDQTPDIGTYKTISFSSGEEIEVTRQYRDFEILLVDDSGEVFATSQLGIKNNSSSNVRFTLDAKHLGKSKQTGKIEKDLQVFVRAKAKVSTSDQSYFDDNEVITFGSYRVRIQI